MFLVNLISAPTVHNLSDVFIATSTGISVIFSILYGCQLRYAYKYHDGTYIKFSSESFPLKTSFSRPINFDIINKFFDIEFE